MLTTSMSRPVTQRARPDHDEGMSTAASFPVITVNVESSYGEHSDMPGQDQHDVTVTIGATPVFSRSYYEPANRHHGEEDWDPVEHFGQHGASEFGYTLARMIDAFERGE